MPDFIMGVALSDFSFSNGVKGPAWSPVEHLQVQSPKGVRVKPDLMSLESKWNW
jgi:hypothetical protein